MSSLSRREEERERKVSLWHGRSIFSLVVRPLRSTRNLTDAAFVNQCARCFPFWKRPTTLYSTCEKKNRKLQLVSKEAFCWGEKRGEYFLRKRVIEWWWDLNHKYSLFLRIRRYILFPGNTLTCSDPGGAAELVSSGFCLSFFFLFTLPPTHSGSHLVGFFYPRLLSLLSFFWA